MKRSICRLALLTAAACGFAWGAASGGAADNWPQWRGPNADGSSATADPPVKWSESENVQWKVPVPGRGSGTPIVWEGRVYLLTAIETEREKEGAAETDATAAAAAQPRPQQEQGAAERGARDGERRDSDRRDGGRPGGFGDRPGGEGGRPGGFGGRPGGFGGRPGGFGGRPGGFGGRGGMTSPAPTHYYQFALLAFDLESGEKLWQTVAAEAVPNEPGHPTNSFASSSPVTDGRHIYASFGSHGVYCFDMQGQQVWQRDLGKMQTRNQFGEGSSPALHDDTLVVPWDHEGQSQLIALDAKTGEIRWAVDRDERTTWATPLIVEHQGRTQVITNGNTVRSYDLKTGQLLWQCGGQVENPIPSPVRMGDVVFCMTGYQGNAVYAIPLDASDDITGSDSIVWSRDDAAPYVASPTLYKGQLYFTKSRDGIVTSVDAKTGEVIIRQQRLPGISSVYASPVAAADRIYFTSRDGATTVIRHGDELEVLATNQLDEGIDASPVIVDDRMLLRGERHLYCIRQAAASGT